MRRPHATEQKTSARCEVCGRKPSRRLRTRNDAGLFECFTCTLRRLPPPHAAEPQPGHAPTVAKRGVLPIDTQYVGRGWKARFTCPVCDRTAWFNLNFLGRRVVVCDGQRWTREREIA